MEHAGELLRQLSDDELMLKLRDTGGAGEPFDEFHRRYHSRVLGWCNRLTRNRDNSTDLTQDIFLRAFRYMHTFRGDSSLATWLYVITRNYCMNALKRRGRDPVDSADPVSPLAASSDGSETYRNLAHRQSSEAMWKLIHATLTPLEARVMTLHYGHEVPLALITRDLQLTNPSGAKAYIVNARRKLSAALDGHRGTRRNLYRVISAAPGHVTGTLPRAA